MDLDIDALVAAPDTERRLKGIRRTRMETPNLRNMVARGDNFRGEIEPARVPLVIRDIVVDDEDMIEIVPATSPLVAVSHLSVNQLHPTTRAFIQSFENVFVAAKYDDTLPIFINQCINGERDTASRTGGTGRRQGHAWEMGPFGGPSLSAVVSDERDGFKAGGADAADEEDNRYPDREEDNRDREEEANQETYRQMLAYSRAHPRPPPNLYVGDKISWNHHLFVDRHVDAVVTEILAPDHAMRRIVRNALIATDLKDYPTVRDTQPVTVHLSNGVDFTYLLSQFTLYSTNRPE
jgi:hypothetical protein